MYTGSNPSALRSRRDIVQAFLRLLKKTPLEEISIKQIMNEAELSRQTFYQIFNNKEEILEHYLDTIFKEFISHSKNLEINNLCQAAKLFFNFFEQYKQPLHLIIKNGKSCVVQRKCREYLLQSQYIHYTLCGVHSQQEQEYATTFVISGMVAMLEQWIRSDDQTQPETQELANLVCRITGTDA